MSKYKFEPFDRVLVRDVYGVWKPDFYGYSCPGFTNAHMLASGVKYPEVLPYTTETAHLIGTSDPYEPPKPPHEYKWGDKVEVNCGGTWRPAIFIGPYSFNALGIESVTVFPRGRDDPFHCPYDLIRLAAPTP